MMNATVFYAWQSDRPSKINRNLIRNAAEAACQRITNDESNNWIVKLDSDTQGVAGMCDIPSTILDKITKCDIFLADLTFVGETDDEKQYMPNCNVIFELGFAARCLSFDSLVGVVNEAYGKIDGQIFDIKKRSSLYYSVSEEDDSTRIEKQQQYLSTQLEEVFRITLETVVTPRMVELEHDREQEFNEIQLDFVDRVMKRNFYDFVKMPATLLTIQTSILKKLDYDKLYENIRNAGRNARPNEEAVFWNDEGQTVELGINGVLFHAYGGVYESFKSAYQQGIMPLARQNPGKPTPSLLPAIPLQKKIVLHVFAQCKLLSTLALPFPWLVGISLVGAKGFNLVTDTYMSPTAIDTNNLPFGPCEITSPDQISDISTLAGCLREILNRLCRKVGWERSDCFTSQEIWNERFFGERV
jgi:hypothetical protein